MTIDRKHLKFFLELREDGYLHRLVCQCGEFRDIMKFARNDRCKRQYYICRKCNRDRCSKYYYTSPNGKSNIAKARRKYEAKMRSPHKSS